MTTPVEHPYLNNYQRQESVTILDRDTELEAIPKQQESDNRPGTAYFQSSVSPEDANQQRP
jgi:hypothetical protein